MSKIDLYPQTDSSPQSAQIQTGTAFPAEKKFAADVNVMGGSIDAEFSGTVSISGLRIRMRTTTMMVTDVATAIPPVALADRNAITITNFDPTEILYLADNNLVTADRALGTTAGHEINPEESFNLDIADTITLFGRCEPGISILIKVTELA